MTSTFLLQTDIQRSTLGGVGFPSRAYDAYGAQASSAGPLMGFAGQMRDPTTGWYHLGNGHRVFNPVLMRFNTPDLLSPFDKGGINAYGYCLGDPVNHHDPSGRYTQVLSPIVSFVANTLGVLSSALRFRVLRNIFRSYDRNSGFPASRTGEVATGTIDLRPSKPTAGDWALSTVSAVTGSAGSTLAALRVAGVMDGDAVMYTNTALTLVSLGTSAVEVVKLVAAHPAFYPIDQHGARFTPRPNSPSPPINRRSSLSPTPSVANVEVRNNRQVSRL